jgi:hypothetical protein
VELCELGFKGCVCEWQAVNRECEFLERMNLRVASEHDSQAEFVENLKQRNDELSEYNATG